MNNENKNIELWELLGKNEMILPIKTSDFSGTFWHYTSLTTANKILLGQTFRCSNIKCMNDKNEAELHKYDGEYMHVLSLCNSNSEKIPMWYLYAGLTGEGVSLGFTPGTMRKLISSIRTVKTLDDKVLHIGTDFDLKYGWMYYRKQDNKRSVMYRGKWYYLKENDISDFEEENYFIKDYPWEYEKEFRIVIKNKTNIPYEKLVIEIPDEVIGSIKIRFAPEIKQDLLMAMMPDLKGFHNVLNKKIEFSKLYISMDLLDRNLEDIVNNISSIVDEKNVSEICKQIREKKLCK